MRENRTSGLMSGEGKRSDAERPKPPRPSSTPPKNQYFSSYDALDKKPVSRKADFMEVQSNVTDIADDAGSEPQRITVVESTVRALKQGIMQARYAPGQRLVEAELMQEYSVSRAPVREALRRLAADGLVDIEPYRGAVVRRLTREGLVNGFQLREVLEGFAARQAAERVAGLGKDAAKIKRALRALLREATDNPDQYMEQNIRFHAFIAELSGNDLVGRALSQVQMPALRAYFPRVLDDEAIQDSKIEHRNIAEAILDGDANRAEQTMREHVRRTGVLAEKLPESLFPGNRAADGVD
jgi:DNA-binding GntR family transcriptional regulator